MLIAALLAVGSLIGLAIILSLHAEQAKVLSEEETRIRLGAPSTLLHDLFGSVYELVYTYFHTNLRPRALDFLAKRVGWFRIFVLRIEQQLLKLEHRIRTSSTLSPKPSEYWAGVHSWKKSSVPEDDSDVPPPTVTPMSFTEDTGEETMPIITADIAPKKRAHTRKKKSDNIVALEHVEATLDEFHL